MRLKIKILPGDYSVFKLPSGSQVPDWVNRTGFYSITDTGEELSIISSGKAGDENCPCESGMTLFKIDAELDFSLTGILNSVTAPLADNKIPVFTLSTFNTDYFLVRTEYVDKAVDALEQFHDIDRHPVDFYPGLLKKD